MKYLIITIYFFFLSMAIYAAPSFNCQKATTKTEKLICANEDLSTLDQNIATVFTKLRQTLAPDVAEELQQGQKAWIRTRDECKDKECLQNNMEHRYQDLIDPVWQCYEKGGADKKDQPWVCYKDDLGYGGWLLHYSSDPVNYSKKIDQAFNATAEENTFGDGFLAIPKLAEKEKSSMTEEQQENWTAGQLEKAEKENRWVNSCAAYHKLVEEQGYESAPSPTGGTDNDTSVAYSDFVTNCDILSSLKKIKAAKISYVKNFNFGKDAIDQLPAELLGLSDKKEDKSIKQFMQEQSKPGQGEVEMTPNSLTITLPNDFTEDEPNDNQGAVITFIARGDLLGNGQEQLLFLSRPWYTLTGGSSGRNVQISYYIVSRDKENGLLKVIH